MSKKIKELSDEVLKDMVVKLHVYHETGELPKGLLRKFIQETKYDIHIVEITVLREAVARFIIPTLAD